MAYIIDHQSTASVSAYGDKRRGKKSGKRLIINAKPAISADKSADSLLYQAKNSAEKQYISNKEPSFLLINKLK